MKRTQVDHSTVLLSRASAYTTLTAKDHQPLLTLTLYTTIRHISLLTAYSLSTFKFQAMSLALLRQGRRALAVRGSVSVTVLSFLRMQHYFLWGALRTIKYLIHCILRNDCRIVAFGERFPHRLVGCMFACLRSSVMLPGPQSQSPHIFGCAASYK